MIVKLGRCQGCLTLALKYMTLTITAAQGQAYIAVYYTVCKLSFASLQLLVGSFYALAANKHCNTTSDLVVKISS